MYQRNIESNIRIALSDTPVVLLNGARQTGKSTLALKLAADFGGLYITLDDATVLSSAVSDPAGFVRNLNGFVVIDEVQKSPGLFPAIKAQVDRNRRPGSFLLTGSANVMMLPRLAESLAGRMEVITLWPLSQGELKGRRERFVDGLFAAELPSLMDTEASSTHLVHAVITGGYPEAVRRDQESRRQAWFSSYIRAVVQRDVRDLANIEGLTDMPRLLTLLAGREGGLLNTSELSRSIAIPHTTLKRYLSLLQATFLLQPLPAWSDNLGKRLIKSPKLYLVDSGMTAHLNGQTAQRLTKDPASMGHLLEGFVVGELRKQITWSGLRTSLFHLRSAAGREVDVVLEDAQGRLVGIEIKASATVSRKSFAGIEAFAEAIGKRFVRGLVLYCGETVVPFGDNLYALPASALWRMP